MMVRHPGKHYLKKKWTRWLERDGEVKVRENDGG